MFLSTVRTCFSRPDLGEQDPFLNNPKVIIIVLKFRDYC